LLTHRKGKRDDEYPMSNTLKGIFDKECPMMKETDELISILFKSVETAKKNK
jgi:hypothetical protein